MQKKKTLTLKKKHKKHCSPSKKSKQQKKSTKKHYGAFKSTHYDPCRNNTGKNCALKIKSIKDVNSQKFYVKCQVHIRYSQY